MLFDFVGLRKSITVEVSKETAEYESTGWCPMTLRVYDTEFRKKGSSSESY